MQKIYQKSPCCFNLPAECTRGTRDIQWLYLRLLTPREFFFSSNGSKPFSNAIQRGYCAECVSKGGETRGKWPWRVGCVAGKTRLALIGQGRGLSDPPYKTRCMATPPQPALLSLLPFLLPPSTYLPNIPSPPSPKNFFWGKRDLIPHYILYWLSRLWDFCYLVVWLTWSHQHPAEYPAAVALHIYSRPVCSCSENSLHSHTPPHLPSSSPLQAHTGTTLLLSFI